jgi:hypothetical protein
LDTKSKIEILLILKATIYIKGILTAKNGSNSTNLAAYITSKNEAVPHPVFITGHCFQPGY